MICATVPLAPKETGFPRQTRLTQRSGGEDAPLSIRTSDGFNTAICSVSRTGLFLRSVTRDFCFGARSFGKSPDRCLKAVVGDHIDDMRQFTFWLGTNDMAFVPRLQLVQCGNWFRLRT